MPLKPKVPDHELVDRFDAGNSCEAIAAAVGLAPSTVADRLRRLGRTFGTRRPFAHRDVAICDAFLAGRAVKQIAADEGMHPTTVRKRLARYGLRRKMGGPEKLPRELDRYLTTTAVEHEAVCMWCAGYSHEAIGARFGAGLSWSHRTVAKCWVDEPTNHDTAEAARLYVEEGWTVDRLRAHFGISQRKIAKGLVRCGVRLRRDTYAEIVSAHEKLLAP